LFGLEKKFFEWDGTHIAKNSQRIGPGRSPGPGLMQIEQFRQDRMKTGRNRSDKILTCGLKIETGAFRGANGCQEEGQKAG
jgi:hypothetical protein